MNQNTTRPRFKLAKKVVAIIPATMLLAMLPTTAQAAPSGSAHFKEGFEKSAAGWVAGTTQVDSGTGGVTSASGTHHGQVTEGAYTRFDGYSAEWTGPWQAEVDVYLDPSWDAGSGFDYSVASSRSTLDDDGKTQHLRDYIFHVTKDTSTGKLLVGASNNTNFAPREDLETLPNHAQVTKAGWYTLQHTFYEKDGALAVDLDVLDPNGDVLFTQTLQNADDTMDKVGGHRYGWFTAVEGLELPVDNTELGSPTEAIGSSYSTDFAGVRIAPTNPAMWHMSGKYDAAITSVNGDEALRISNAKTSGSFGDQLFSPTLGIETSESAKNNQFDASFVIEPSDYQEGLAVTVSPDNGQGGRNGFIKIKHVDGGMTVETTRYFVNDAGELDFEYVTVAEGLDVGKKHTVEIQAIQLVDDESGVANDQFRVSVDGKKAVEGTTFEAYYDATGEDNYGIDTLLFRVSGTAAPGTAGAGIMIDDLEMSIGTYTPEDPVTETPPVVPPVTPPVTPPATTPPTKPTPPKVTPPTTPVTPPTATKPGKTATVSAKTYSKKAKLHVNVNPNKGKGYWKVQVEKKTANGWETLPKTYKTKGKAETVKINLPAGEYRVKVLPKYGYAGGTSQSVVLVK